MDASRFFPPTEKADEYGMVAEGGVLSTECLLDAYRHGIFPWPASERQLTWWSPDPRAIIELDGMHVSRRLARTCRSGRFEVTGDRDFAGVVQGCATSGHRRRNTWITPGIRTSYQELCRLGHAHSIEAWRDGKLAGGLYGVSIGGAFSAESMFYNVSDASKVALVFLVEHLKSRGYALLDIQQLTPHARSLGAKPIPRREFLRRLDEALRLNVSFGSELCVAPKQIHARDDESQPVR